MPADFRSRSAIGPSVAMSVIPRLASRQRCIATGAPSSGRLWVTSTHRRDVRRAAGLPPTSDGIVHLQRMVGVCQKQNRAITDRQSTGVFCDTYYWRLGASANLRMEIVAYCKRRTSAKSSPREPKRTDCRASVDPRAATAARPGPFSFAAISGT